MTKRKPETTSKEVASKAAPFMGGNEFREIVNDLRDLRWRIDYIIMRLGKVEINVKSVAASALTQTKNKKKK